MAQILETETEPGKHCGDRGGAKMAGDGEEEIIESDGSETEAAVQCSAVVQLNEDTGGGRDINIQYY